MRKPFVAGNWKMNKTVEQSRQLVAELLPELQKVPSVERVLCPPFPALMPIAAMLAGSGIGLGAQNLHWEASGAFTGEVAPAMVKEFCQYVIIGHSERRIYFGETDATVNKRIKAALAVGLIPIVCVGETLVEYENSQTAEVVTRQMISGLEGIPEEQARMLVVAYEPVWAIGTGKAASGVGANHVVEDVIRVALTALFGRKVAQGTRVLYGGSVTAVNAAEFFSQPEIDGALVGGASLKPAEFAKDSAGCGIEMTALFTGLGWLVASLLLFLVVQRWLHREIHAFFLILTRRPAFSVGLFSLIFFPGVFLHETSHYLMARILGVRTGRFSLLPQVMANGTLRLGYVETARTDLLRDALIGTAPLFTGGLVIAYLGISQLKLSPIINLASLGFWQQVWLALAAVPNQPDFALWFYLAFTVSSTMLPSNADRRAWLPLLVGLGVLLILALLVGAGEWMLQHLAPGLDQALRALAMVFSVSLVVHLALVVPVGLVRALLSKVTGLQVVSS